MRCKFSAATRARRSPSARLYSVVPRSSQFPSMRTLPLDFLAASATRSSTGRAPLGIAAESKVKKIECAAVPSDAFDSKSGWSLVARRGCPAIGLRGVKACGKAVLGLVCEQPAPTRQAKKIREQFQSSYDPPCWDHLQGACQRVGHNWTTNRTFRSSEGMCRSANPQPCRSATRRFLILSTSGLPAPEKEKAAP
jgi:hypothetical protein